MKKNAQYDSEETQGKIRYFCFSNNCPQIMANSTYANKQNQLYGRGYLIC